MKFNAGKINNVVEIGELGMGDTFIDLDNFTNDHVFMVITARGYDCHVDFDDEYSTIAVIDLTSGELWSYKEDEEVIPVETEEVKFKVI